MNKLISKKLPCCHLVCAALTLFSLAACSPVKTTPIPNIPATSALPTSTRTTAPTNTPTPAATFTLPPPTATSIPATPTPEPTFTSTITPTLAVVAGSDGFNAWCLPQTALTANMDTTKPWLMPSSAKPVEVIKDLPQLVYPAASCTFVFNFNQPVPKGAKLEFYYAKYAEPSPWLTEELTPVEGTPNQAYVTITHTYVVNPPLWKVTYRLIVRTADGVEQWSNQVRFVRSWQMARCWNGTLPNPITLECPKITWGDVHPSDWGYGLPTHTPVPANP